MRCIYNCGEGECSFVSENGYCTYSDNDCYYDSDEEREEMEEE